MPGTAPITLLHRLIIAALTIVVPHPAPRPAPLTFHFPGPAPAFTGNDSNLHLQGLYHGRPIYIGPWQSAQSPNGAWGQYCNQIVSTGPAGSDRRLGYYVDDSVSEVHLPPFTNPATNERACVVRDRAAFPHALIIAATDGQADTQHLTGASIDAREWYPYCGDGPTAQMPPTSAGYILQYNFVRSVINDGSGQNCGPTPLTAIAQLWAEVLPSRPQLLIYY